LVGSFLFCVAFDKKWLRRRQRQLVGAGIIALIFLLDTAWFHWS
jgi:hypothetical protein